MPASVRRTAPSNVILNIADLRNSMLETALSNDDDDDADSANPTITAADALQLQPLSTEEQQLLSLQDHPQHESQPHSQHSCEGSHLSSQASHDSRHRTQDRSQDIHGGSQASVNRVQNSGSVAQDTLGHNNGSIAQSTLGQNSGSNAQDTLGQNDTVDVSQNQHSTSAAESSFLSVGQAEYPTGNQLVLQADSTAVINDAADVHVQHQDIVPQYGRSLSAMRGSRVRPPLASVRFSEEPDTQSHV